MRVRQRSLRFVDGSVVDVGPANLRLYRVRPALSFSRKSEHTHLRQIASRETSSCPRNLMAGSLFNTSENVPSRRFPKGGWKKQGRTDPSDSITADTQGALHRG